MKTEQEEKNLLKEYNERCKSLKQECDDMVAKGQLSKTDAFFRYFMMKDEILQEMEFDDDENETKTN